MRVTVDIDRQAIENTYVTPEVTDRAPDGTDKGAVETACAFASRIAAGHCFVVVLRESFPINVLNRIKAVEEVVGVYCATSNNVTVLVGESGTGRGVLGVVDGVKPKGLETEGDKKERHDLLRKIGYKK